MPLLDTLKNVATLGGHGALQEATARYKTAYDKNQELVNQANRTKGEIDRNVERLGKTTEEAFGLLKEVQALAGGSIDTVAPSNDAFPLDGEAPTVAALLKQYDATVGVAKGASVGALAAIGSWSLVGLLGSASTGTALASLSGAAATNATLAWFGGGALAAGGAGVVGGAMVLGGIAIAPIVVVAVKAYSKAAELKEATTALAPVIEKNGEVLANLNTVLRDVRNRSGVVEGALGALRGEKVAAERLLFPKGWLSRLLRLLRGRWWGSYYDARDVGAFRRLQLAGESFAATFLGRPIEWQRMRAYEAALASQLPNPEFRVKQAMIADIVAALSVVGGLCIMVISMPSAFR